MKISFVFVLLFSSAVVRAQTVNYSPAYFGPNANPVSKFTNGKIVRETTIELAREHYFGFGDHTRNFSFLIEVPLLSERIAFKVWVPLLERWRVTQEISDYRNMKGDALSGTAAGDFYVQTRMLILSENNRRPNIILNSTLKTASGTNFNQRRYFDTPGYYFDLEIGKSLSLENRFLNEIRFVANLGFLCWETTNSTQNDAPMYGWKIILSNHWFDFDNTLAGYFKYSPSLDNLIAKLS